MRLRTSLPQNHRVWLALPSSLLEVPLIPRDACPSSFTGAQLLKFSLHQTPLEIRRGAEAYRPVESLVSHRLSGTTSSAGTETGLLPGQAAFPALDLQLEWRAPEAFAGVLPLLLALKDHPTFGLV